MTPLKRFNAWLQGSKVQYPNQSGVAPGITYDRAWDLAMQLGHRPKRLYDAVNEIRHWLAKNEHTGKANKTLWGKFFLNWLTPNNWNNGGRLEPSNFD